MELCSGFMHAAMLVIWFCHPNVLLLRTAIIHRLQYHINASYRCQLLSLTDFLTFDSHTGFVAKPRQRIRRIHLNMRGKPTDVDDLTGSFAILRVSVTAYGVIVFSEDIWCNRV